MYSVGLDHTAFRKIRAAKSGTGRVERVRVHDDGRPVAAQSDGDDIEAARALGQAMTRKEVGRNGRHASTLGPGDRVGSAPELDTGPCLHFNEHNRWTIGCDNVDFAASPAVSTRNDCVPPAAKFITREVFSDFSQRHARTGHAAPVESKA